ncbi:MAG: DNA polymerase III subunit delta' [Bacteroidaceae bacterium]|nr:DNA polymerase III subunit delta' [Bacteroidaceae bacterium]
MYFKDIIGQDSVIRMLRTAVAEGRIPHAQLFCGPEGTGKLSVAIAYARYLCCAHRSGEDACGECPSCKKFDKLMHPDLHFAFPIYKKDSNKTPRSDDFIDKWRQAVAENPYMNLNQWMSSIGTENQQGLIYASQSEEIIRKLTLKSSEGGYKVMIVWMAEKMNTECANKLLKMIEEPPAQTVFLLLAENPDLLLPTIQSRVQRLALRPIEESIVSGALTEKYGLTEADARQIAHASAGNWLQAVETIHLGNRAKEHIELFMTLMRRSYARDLKGMRQWAETVAGIGREPQKNFLVYCQRMIRESFICNFRRPEINYMNTDEANFTSRFAPFVNEKNIFGIMDELSEAQRHIEQNVNPKMVFFDLALKMIMLLKQ